MKTSLNCSLLIFPQGGAGEEALGLAGSGPTELCNFALG